MAQIQSNALRPGMIFTDGDNRYLVLKYSHIKKGRGQAVIRLKIKDIDSKSITEATYTNEQKLGLVDAEKRNAQYLYRDQERYNFMDSADFSQFYLTEDDLGDLTSFLKEGLEVIVLFVEGDAVSIELPKVVELEVEYTEPAVAGNTSSGATKEAKMESGATVQVPLFIKTGDVLRINTLTGTYVSRI